MTNPDDPAINDIGYGSSGDHYHDQCYKNLTKREYFAAMALTGILANPEYATRGVTLNDRELTIDEAALKISDALIARLNKEPK